MKTRTRLAAVSKRRGAQSLVLSLLMSVFAWLHLWGGPLDARLTFSTDGGKTWSEDHPTVQAGQAFRLRATYTIGDERDNRDALIASLMFPEKYASTTKDRGGWFEQRHAVYWKSSKVNSFYEWTVDPTGLQPGTHCFRVSIGYWVKDPQEHVTDDQVVYLTIVSQKD